MRAAGLHAIATVLDTEAVLIAGLPPDGTSSFKHPEHGPLADVITNRIAGVLAANRYVICQYNIPEALLPKATLVTPGRRAPTISPLVNSSEPWVAVSVMVEKSQVARVMDELVALGAHDVLVIKLDNCRV